MSNIRKAGLRPNTTLCQDITVQSADSETTDTHSHSKVTPSVCVCAYMVVCGVYEAEDGRASGGAEFREGVDDGRERGGTTLLLLLLEPPVEGDRVAQK